MQGSQDDPSLLERGITIETNGGGGKYLVTQRHGPFLSYDEALEFAQTLAGEAENGEEYIIDPEDPWIDVGGEG